MSARRPTGPLVLAAIAAALTSWAALSSWRGFLMAPSEYLTPLMVVAVVVALVGGTLRWLGVPGVLVFAAQLLGATVVVCGQVAGSVVPSPGALEAVRAALDLSVESARVYAAPIGGDAPPVAPLLIACGAVVILLVDLLACTLRRVPVAGLVLLAAYAVPAGLVERGPGWLSFLGAAIGFLLLLHLESRDQLLRWGHSIGPSEAAPWAEANPVADAVRAGAGRIGITATALALAVPVFLPVLDLDLLGMGPGTGNDDIQIQRPQADMRRDLERGEDVALVRLRTDDPQPSYLRIAVLNRFTGLEWSSGDRIGLQTLGDDSLPPPTGVAPAIPSTSYDYELEAEESFDSTWLPSQYPVTAIEAEGDWRFDEASMDFLAADGSTAGIEWSMTGVHYDFGTEGTWFRDALPGSVDEELLEVPGGVPSEVPNYAQQVTAGATSSYEEALLLQRWFRQDGGFRYSLEDAPEGMGGDTFATFLDDGPGGRVGYCEQFASAMAVMARTLGIPARVAVGFLQPTRIGADEWEYSSHDLHAWPELYFQGAGWVRFEPTPAGRADSVPDYSRVPVDVEQEPELPTNPEEETTDPRGRDNEPTERPTEAPAEPEAEAGGAAAQEDGWLGTTLIVLALTLLVGGLLVLAALTPRNLRARARARRLAGDPEEQWAEVRATAVDLSVPWPDGRSPRETAAVLVEHMDGGAAPLDRLVARLERARYSRTDEPVTGTALVADTEACLRALEEAASPRARRRATWLPRSLADRQDRSVPDTRSESLIG